MASLSDSMNNSKVELGHLLKSAGAASESPPDSIDNAKVESEHFLESAGAASDTKESEPVSLPKARRSSRSKHPVSGHPKGKQTRPNNKKKKNKRRGKEQFLL